MRTSLEDQLRDAIDGVPSLRLEEVQEAGARLRRQRRHSTHLAAAAVLSLAMLGGALALVVAGTATTHSIAPAGSPASTTGVRGREHSKPALLPPAYVAQFVGRRIYGPVTGTGPSGRITFLATGGRLAIVFACSGHGVPRLVVDDHRPIPFASCEAPGVDSVGPYLVRRGARVSISVLVPAQTRWALAVGTSPLRVTRTASAEAVALSFALALGNHDCQFLPALSTLRRASATWAPWVHLCENASGNLRTARVSRTVPFPSLEHVSGAVEVTITTGGGRPTRFGPMNLEKGMTVVVGRPRGSKQDRVLAVAEPLMPPLGPNYGWTFH